MLRLLAAGVLALSLPLAASANALVDSVKGDVQAAGAPIFQGQRVLPPATFTTGAGAQAILRFEDGMQIVLNENSLLRMVDFRYTTSGATDRGVFELLRGAARVVTGAVAENNPKQFAFRTPQTELRVERGADFSVALVNPAYLTVHAGSVISANAWGTATLKAGSTSVVANSGAAPAAVSAASLPPAASAAMTNLSVAAVTPPAGGSSFGIGGAAATEAGRWVPYVLFGAVVVGVAAFVANEDDNSPQSTTTHH